MAEPTLGEVMRRLDANTQQLAEITRQMREDRDRADMRYVPRVEWVEARRGVDERFKNVEGDVVDLKNEKRDEKRGRTAFQRAVIVAVCTSAVTGLISLATIGLQLLGK